MSERAKKKKTPKFELGRFRQPNSEDATPSQKGNVVAAETEYGHVVGRNSGVGGICGGSVEWQSEGAGSNEGGGR